MVNLKDFGGGGRGLKLGTHTPLTKGQQPLGTWNPSLNLTCSGPFTDSYALKQELCITDATLGCGCMFEEMKAS
ncbi:hypothetical protein DPMN_085191 [Dreissena polymorpha]|uniref:Uncharacterized protein n=1 Tax=Dreissena polymorpha TaxID=45954 RepID=A0A9D3YCB3_DREPO|nr:hypothetical protein DPMN_085191 [Dreissena polymorpha]